MPVIEDRLVRMTQAQILKEMELELNQPISPDMLLSDLKMDSLEYMSLVLKLEDKTGARLPRHLVAGFKTAGGLADWFSE